MDEQWSARHGREDLEESPKFNPFQPHIPTQDANTPHASAQQPHPDVASQDWLSGDAKVVLVAIVFGVVVIFLVVFIPKVTLKRKINL